MVTANERVALRRGNGGWWHAELSPELARADYAFSIDGGPPLPDPRSPYQPSGVHGFSRPVDHSAFEWRSTKWQPAPLSFAIIYECHIGTFTPAGTFDAAIERLGYLRDLGVTHVELMPVAEFSGERGWGYDGVDLFAPHHLYGGPDAMKRFVDAAHGHGLGVILDVVYNHLGPEGNYLAKFGSYFTDRYRTPWGDAVNLDDRDSDEVRRFLCDNALMWLRDYRVDGLRIDAVHAIFDASAIHFLEQLGAEVDQLEAEVGRHLIVIAESDLNQPRIVTRARGGWLRPGRAMERRFSSRAAYYPDRRNRRLPGRLRIDRAAREVSYARLRLRRYVFEEPAAQAWQAGARAFGPSICCVHAESRSGR